jgi:hypothetical protein
MSERVGPSLSRWLAEIAVDHRRCAWAESLDGHGVAFGAAPLPPREDGSWPRARSISAGGFTTAPRANRVPKCAYAFIWKRGPVVWESNGVASRRGTVVTSEPGGERPSLGGDVRWSGGTVSPLGDPRAAPLGPDAGAIASGRFSMMIANRQSEPPGVNVPRPLSFRICAARDLTVCWTRNSSYGSSRVVWHRSLQTGGR